MVPLSGLLSQALVAFTVELDDEFERRMAESGHRGARLSLVWSNLETGNLRASLQRLLERRDGDRLLLSVGPGASSGSGAGWALRPPALGRVSVGPAARQRVRDLVAQTEAFVRDPLNALPHYPVWDMNRGFGP
jgi:hypothetical protein